MGPHSKIFIIRSEFKQNTAPGGVGGAIASHGGRVWLMAGSRLSGNSALYGGGIGYSSDLNVLWPTGIGGENGRLFASSSCIFVVAQLDFTLIGTSASKFDSMSILDAKGSAVDARGVSTFMYPKGAVVNKAEFCLSASTYYLGVYDAAGGKNLNFSLFHF